MTSPIIAALLAFIAVLLIGVLFALAAIFGVIAEIENILRGGGESLLTKPLNMYGETIGDAIQGQLERGFRQ